MVPREDQSREDRVVASAKRRRDGHARSLFLSVLTPHMELTPSKEPDGPNSVSASKKKTLRNWCVVDCGHSPEAHKSAIEWPKNYVIAQSHTGPRRYARLD
jgi:hypothetical protein